MRKLTLTLALALALSAAAGCQPTNAAEPAKPAPNLDALRWQLAAHEQALRAARYEAELRAAQVQAVRAELAQAEKAQAEAARKGGK